MPNGVGMGVYDGTIVGSETGIPASTMAFCTAVTQLLLNKSYSDLAVLEKLFLIVVSCSNVVGIFTDNDFLPKHHLILYLLT